jgi:UDP-2,3-diacylglucosamine pyrophosphatase LpxH
MSSSILPDPCPLDLELRLAPGGRLVYLSDLHLTDTGPADDFAATDELCELIGSLHDHPGQVLLALGGDILDLLQVEGSMEERAARALDGPAAAVLGAALCRLAARPGVTILYLVGNHDAALAWNAAARKLVAERFGVTEFALHARIRVARPDLAGEVVVVAEHGDALDRWNRRTDPFDPLDVPIGDHIVTEFVNKLELASGRYPELALDEVDNVRPGILVPWWLVSNFFYKFMGRALRDFALPLVLLTIALNLAVGLLVGDVGRIAYLGNRAVRWVASFVLTNLALIAVLSTFLGRSFRRAAAAYGVPSPDEASEEAENRQADLPALLQRRDPEAAVLLTGHTHEPRIVRLPGGQVAVDGGCWVRGLVPVRARLSLPPVFVPVYPVNWVDIQPGGQCVEGALWERRLAVRRRLGRIERLVARRPLPPADAAPAKVLARVVLPDDRPRHA